MTPQNSVTAESIYKIQTVFDRYPKMYRRKLNAVDLGVTDDVPGQVKVKMFDDLTYLVLSRTTAVSNGNRSIKTWIVSGTLLSIILSFQ